MTGHSGGYLSIGLPYIGTDLMTYNNNLYDPVHSSSEVAPLNSVGCATWKVTFKSNEQKDMLKPSLTEPSEKH